HTRSDRDWSSDVCSSDLRRGMMSKKLTYALALCLVVLTAGCQKQNAPQQPDGSTAPSGNKTNKQVELTFWYPYGDKIGEANENLVKQFNESQNEIKVKAAYQGNYTDILSKLQAAAVAKNAPDVFVAEDIAAAPLARTGILEDLTGAAEESKMDLKDFLPSVLANSY